MDADGEAADCQGEPGNGGERPRAGAPARCSPLSESLPSDLSAAHAMIVAERAARLEAEALASPAALYYASRDRRGEHPARLLQGFAGILQALQRLQRAVRPVAHTGTDHRGLVLGSRSPPILRAGGYRGPVHMDNPRNSSSRRLKSSSPVIWRILVRMGRSSRSSRPLSERHHRTINWCHIYATWHGSRDDHFLEHFEHMRSNRFCKESGL